MHQDQVHEDTRAFWNALFGTYERESERWSNAILAAENRVAEDTSLIHVCDREADMNSVLQTLHARGLRYVIRAYQERKTVERVSVYEVPRQGSYAVHRTIELCERPVNGALPKSRRTFAPRRARRAEVVIRGHRATFAIGRDLDPVQINVVEAFEEAPPKGEEPVHWVLLTSEPIESEQDLLHVIDIYRSRWMIEEYFKAIKTGCSYEQRQLDSASTLLAALGITLVVAWQLLVLRHLSRLEEQRTEGALALSALIAVTPQQLAVLMALTPKLKWPPEPTLSDAVRGIARLGGHHQSNGPPGWQVLGRGFQKLMAACATARRLATAGLVIDA